MSPTPEQIRRAAMNHHTSPRTLHARVRDALLHVKQSEKKPANSPDETGGLITFADSDYGTDETESTGT